jgi:hypothetical protein
LPMFSRAIRLAALQRKSLMRVLCADYAREVAKVALEVGWCAD